MRQATSIEEVIEKLDGIIEASKHDQSPNGYFAALYRKVTLKVKAGISDGYFENGPRMELLDVVFANRYLEAYESYHTNQVVTESWQKTFELSNNYWPIVIQHLLIGMNAHINLDLGIAAAEISKNSNIHELQEDFNRINEILASLIDEVQVDLTECWPNLKTLLKLSGKVDDWMVGFSMKITRDGAWRFAVELSETPKSQWHKFIQARDQKISNTGNIVASPGFIISTIFAMVRIGETGSVSDRITKLVD